MKKRNGNRYGALLRRALIPALIAVLLSDAAARAEYSPPKNPDEPVIVTPSGDDRGGKKGETELEVTVVTARGERITGILLTGAAAVDVEVAENGAVVKKSVPLAGIASVEILRWQGKSLRKEEYVFRPAHIRLTMADKTVYECLKDIRIFGTLRVRALNRVRAVYSYFYDYRRDKKWKNSGMEDIRYPETNPHGDTAVQIVFARRDTNLLERILGR